VGSGLPAHCTAGGKVLLANQPAARLDVLLASALPRMTRRSKTSATIVRRELEDVRRLGYAVNDQESEEGLRAVAILVPRSGRRSVDAALTVAGPAQRMDDGVLVRLAMVAKAVVGAGGV
jgi:IclR family acetate operon transcriptional repressor